MRRSVMSLKYSAFSAGLLLSALINTGYASSDNDDLKELQQGSAKNEWILVREDKMHNISAWYKQEDGKKTRSFRGEAVMDVPMENVIRVLNDPDRFERWFWNCTESRSLKHISASEFFFYMKINAPAPVPDRDDVLHITMEPYSKKKGFFLYQLKAAPDFMAPVSGLVRVPEHAFDIKLTPLSANSVKLELMGYVDPGGNIPKWGFNFLQQSATYITILGLLRQARTVASDLPVPTALLGDYR